jgi:hypothetical protein
MMHLTLQLTWCRPFAIHCNLAACSIVARRILAWEQITRRFTALGPGGGRAGDEARKEADCSPSSVVKHVAFRTGAAITTWRCPERRSRIGGPLLPSAFSTRLRLDIVRRQRRAGPPSWSATACTGSLRGHYTGAIRSRCDRQFQQRSTDEVVPERSPPPRYVSIGR